MVKPPYASQPAHRFWVINSHTTNQYAPILKPQSVVVIPIPRDALTKTAISFSQFDRENPNADTIHTTLNAILYAVHLMRCIAEEAKMSSHDQLVQIRLETVFSADEANPKVLQYRLWIFVVNPLVSVGDGIEAMLDENARIHAHRDGTSTVVAPAKGKGAPHANTRLLPGQKDWRSALFAHESYRLIKDKQSWARKYCDFYIGSTRTEARMDKVLSLKEPLNAPENPANPANVFNAIDAIMAHTPADAHPLQKDISNYRQSDAFQGTVMYTFPDMNHLNTELVHLLKLHHNEAQPSIFAYRWLPEYQVLKLSRFCDDLLDEFPDLRKKWDAFNVTRAAENDEFEGTNRVSLNPEDQAKRAQLMQDDMIQNEPHPDERPFETRNATSNYVDPTLDMMANRMVQYCYTSDFKILRDEHTKALDEMKKLAPEAYRAEYDRFEQEAFEKFEGRCWTADSDISEVGHSIRTWGTSNDARTFRPDHQKFDPSMSVFGNMVGRRMENIENYMFVANTHTVMFLMLYGRLDAYRHASDLHFNLLGTGVGGTSKSFLFSMIRDASIPNTVEELSYETLRASAIDSDCNDTIILMNEIPEDMIETRIGGGNTHQSAWKERLTAMKVSARVYHKDDLTGERSARTTISECIGVWMGMTNIDVSKTEEALMTRFYQASFVEAEREMKNITSLMHASKGMSDKDKRRSKEFTTEIRMEQYKYFLVEKMIMTRCLPDFDNKTARIFFKDVMDRLKKDGRNIHTRTVERMMLITRILSICLAFEYLFNIPTARFYGKPFEPSQLRYMKEYMYPTEEVMFFVLGLFNEQLVNPMESMVLETLFCMHTSSKDPSRFREISVEDEEAIPGINYSNSTGTIPKKKQPDYNYIAVRTGWDKLSTELYRIMSGSACRPSPAQIRGILLNLKNRTIKSKDWHKDNPLYKEPVLNEASDLSEGPAVISDRDGLYFHYVLFCDNDSDKSKNNKLDKIAELIESMFYNHTVPRRIVHGITEEGHPNLFKVIETKKSDRSMAMYNVLHITDCGRLMMYNSDKEMLEDTTNRGSEFEILDMDMDTYSIYNILESQRTEATDEKVASLHPCCISEAENKWIADANGLDVDGSIKRTFRYPDVYKRQDADRKRRYKEILSSGDGDVTNSRYFASNKRMALGTGKRSFRVPANPSDRIPTLPSTQSTSAPSTPSPSLPSAHPVAPLSPATPSYSSTMPTYSSTHSSPPTPTDEGSDAPQSEDYWKNKAASSSQPVKKTAITDARRSELQDIFEGR